ncbi:hypothetical protein N431DRAFT_561376 [Stipitochalara longipes BDJ]|nr:hypothetical protein N431DRAFT_561376 [Stipitochalara longipes BDJ]
MKSKACTRCRQWKVRCDAEDCMQMGCTRCRSLKTPCVFDPSFKRLSMTKRWQQVQSELTQLKQAQQAQQTNQAQPPQIQQPLPGSPAHNLLYPSNQPLSAPVNQGNSIQACTVASASEPEPPRPRLPSSIASSFSVSALISTSQATYGPALVASEQVPSSNLVLREGTRYDKSIGDIHLTAAQVSELFKSYRASHHRFLPFTMLDSSEAIYTKSSLLFWVICAVASSNRLKPRFAPHIRHLIAEILTSPARSVETVQALLIICMWPFTFISIADDASFLYSGLATQLGLQLGLHRPFVTHTHVGGSEQQDAETDFEPRLSTWLACFVVNDMQSSYRGVPSPILVDFSLLTCINHPKVDRTLARLCHISRLHIQSSLTIGAKAENKSGLLEPSSRTVMVTLFGAQYAALLQDYLQPIDDIIETAFLSSRIQLWSFALLDDMAFTADLLEIYQQAEKDAIRLIQLGCERNLSSAPFHIGRSIVYSAMVLIKILKSSYALQPEAILDHIDRARQAVNSSIMVENDVTRKAWQILQELPLMQDRKLTPQVFSRMTASMFYDSLRVYAENKNPMLASAQSTNEIDLDGFDWDSFQL